MFNFQITSAYLYENIHWVDENKGNPVKKEEMPSVLKAQIFNPFVCLLSKSQTTEIQVIW